MKSKSLPILVALAMAALLLGLTSLAVAASLQPNQQDRAAATDPAGVAPQELPAGTGSPGVYGARDWRVIDPDSYPAVGGQDTFTWAELQPTEATYDWSRLDSFIATQVAKGKKAAIAISTFSGHIEGGLAALPDWLETNYPSTLISCATPAGWKVPKYWNSAYLTKYGAFVNALAAHVGPNANVSYVQIGVGLYGETQPSDDMDNGCITAAMDAEFSYTTDAQRSAKWVQTVNAITDKYGTAFSGKPQKLFLVYTPSFLLQCERRDVTLYAAGKYGVGLFAGGIYPDTVQVLSEPPGGMGCNKWDPIIYWSQSPTATIPVAIESYNYMLPDFQAFYWGVLGALDKHTDYLSLESDLFFANGDVNQPKSTNLAMMRWANGYLGKAPATAPNAWIALRDTTPSHNGHGCNKYYFYPEFGDYTYWLYRDDTAADGRTVTRTNTMTFTIGDGACGTVGQVVNDPQYDPALAGKGHEGWVTRRTDQAGGSPYMYFRLDDAFVSGQGITTAMQITVTYFDKGNDSWYLEYKTSGGADRSLAVNKTNTNTWLRAVFTPSDMAPNGLFANGNDFRLYSGGDGDEYVHMIQVGKLRTGEPTPTPTRTATPTPQTLVFQQGVSPSPAYSGARDTFISNYGSEQNQNYGDDGVLRLRNSDYKAGLLKFDISSISGYATVLSATLSVHVDQQGNANSLPVSLYKMRRNWADMQATWNQAASGAPWGQPGANDPSTDHDPAAFASATLGEANVWIDVDVTGLVQQWVQNPGANYGVALKTGDAGQVEKALRSSDYFASPIFRPKLTVEFRVPTGNTPTPTRTSTPGPTFTPTRTPTRTATPPPAPVQLVFQNGVGPFTTYDGVRDTYISNYNPGDQTVNYGLSPTLRLRSGDLESALIRWDISSVPAGANIVSAAISVHVDYRSNETSVPVSMYRMLRPWEEMQATWIKATNAANWATAGANGSADRSLTATAAATFSEANVWYNFDATNLVRQWVTNPADNKGVIFKAGSSGAQVEYALRSSQYFAAPSYRPKLTINCFGCQGYRLSLPVILSKR